jgi:hypothetical protein
LAYSQNTNVARLSVPDAPVIPADRGTALRVTLPDTSIAIPQDHQRRDLFPIRAPKPPKFPRRPSLAQRRRSHLMNT